MSENIPESIPTSSDPRSKRPLKKKRALSPRSTTASAITQLFSHPEREIILPPSTNTSTSLVPGAHPHQPPEIVQNVQGSSAGAGSGEFHVYKASRRREYERLRGMEEEVKREEEGEKWERERREREEKDREKTRKNREKRERLKGKKGAKSGGEGGAKIQPRIEVKEGAEGLGGEGNSEEAGGVNVAAVEEVGIVICDDD